MKIIVPLLLLLACGIASSQEVEIASEPPIFHAYEKNRQAFLDGKQTESLRFQDKRKTVSYSESFLAKQKEVKAEDERLQEFERRLDDRIRESKNENARIQTLVNEAQRKVDAEQGKIRAEKNSVARARDQLKGFTAIRTGLLAWFFPLIGLGAMSMPMASSFSPLSGFPGVGGATTIIFFLFFSIWAINVFITLWKKERTFMRRNKWVMGAVLFVFLCMLSAPLFAENVVEEDAFISQLELVDKILGQSDYQRFIAILEQKPQQEITLPALDIQVIHLKPFKQVTVDTGEYYFTLGALYEHVGRVGDAVTVIKKIKNSSIKSTNQNAVLTASIKFLIDHRQTGAASALLADSRDKLTNVASLVDLAVFLDQKGMQASSDDILDRAISIAKHYDDLIRLAQVFHENGSRDKAAEALERAISSTNKTSNLVNLSKLAGIMNYPEKSSQALDSAIKSTNSTSELIDLSKLAAEMNFPGKSSQALDGAIAMAVSVNDLIALSQYASKINNQEKLVAALEKALDKTTTPEELIRIARTAITGRHDSIIDRINEKADRLLDVHGRMELIDLYRENKHNEDAVEVFEALIKNVQKSDADKQISLLQYADLAIERGMYEQARNAIERLASLAGSKRNQILVAPNKTLSGLEGIPEKESLELQLYYGLLNEEMDFDDKAEDSYKNSVKRALKDILESYGYDTPDNVNNFYLLGRIWKELGEHEKLEKLDRVYTDIELEILKKIRTSYDKELLKLQGKKDEEGYLELNKKIAHQSSLESSLKIREKNDQSNMQRSIESLENKLASLKELLPVKQREVAEYREYIKETRREIALDYAHVAASTLFLLSLIMGGALWAYHKHAKYLDSSKTFGFIAKFIETQGWIKMLSIIGVIPGIMFVLFGQVMQIFQRNNQELEKLRQLAVMHNNPIAAPVASTSQELEHENS